jgi:hypothetical protein
MPLKLREPWHKVEEEAVENHSYPSFASVTVCVSHFAHMFVSFGQTDRLPTDRDGHYHNLRNGESHGVTPGRGGDRNGIRPRGFVLAQCTLILQAY